MSELIQPVLDQAPHRAVGVVVIHDGQAWTRTYGRRSVDRDEPFDVDTTFEIGSISKGLVGVLLGDAVARGEVELDDPVRQLLPEGWNLPTQNGTEITLLHLATHTSGFPMMPTNWVPMDRDGNRTLYDAAMFREFLSEYRPSIRPGTDYAYGNVSTAILATALATRAGTSFHDLLSTRVLEPLGMVDSEYRDRPLRTGNVLDGYDEENQRMPRRVDVSPIGPCCAISTTLRDMQRLMRSVFDDDSPLAEAFRMSMRAHFGRNQHLAMGLGWEINRRSGAIFKNGQVAGYRSMLVLVPEQRFGLFVVVNSEQVDVTGLAMTLVDGTLGARQFGGHALARFRDQHRRWVIPEIPSTATPAEADFGDSIRWVGYRAPSEAHAGDRVRVTFYYRCLRPVNGDYMNFIHGDSTNSDAERIRGDHYPGGGADSTEVWQPGDLIADEFTLEIPRTYRASSFSVFTGWFRSSTRLHASSTTMEVQNDRVRGPLIRVLP